MSRLAHFSLFVLLSLLWGLSFPAISVGLEYLPPLLFAAFRYDIAAILLLGYAVIHVDGWLPTGRNNLEAIIGGGLFLVAGNGLLFIGQQTVPSGVAAILVALVPITTALWAIVLLGERLSTLGTIGIGVGFLGITFIFQPTPGLLLAGDTIGRLLIITQVISVSLGGVLIQRAAPTINRVALSGWAMALGALCLHIASIVMGEWPTASITTPTAIGAMVYLGVFSTAIAFLIYFMLLEEYGAFEAALVSYLVPVVATIVGVFVLGETIGLLTLVGFGFVVTGFLLLKRDEVSDILGLSADVVRP